MKPKRSLNGAPNTPAYAAARDIIRAEILSGNIPAGSRLTAGSLVKRFAISQMPVREALQALEGEGLITIRHHKGATVLALDAKRIGHIYDLLSAVEILLMRSALPNITNAAMTKLQDMQQAMHLAKEGGDSAKLFELNSQFHVLIFDYSESPDLLGIYDRYVNLLRAWRARFGFTASRMSQMLEQHEEMLEALKAEDLQRLEKIVHSHSQGAKHDLVSLVEEEERSVCRSKEA
ncbi:MAG: GntR family transcriptional regulator [Rhizobiaceae bacterium]|nr:GntR family transcriptional regulator [Rhizobiaceae bacterium]